MTPLSTLEAYDLLRHCALLADRLADEEVLQLSRADLELEKVWLSQACVLVQAQRPGLAELLARTRDLPELELVREDYSEELQDAWVDALEKLHAALVLHTSSRAPIVETLFPHVKFPALRRASAEAMRAYSVDLERRSRLGYVKRIFGQDEYAFVEPLVLAVFETFERWESCFRPSEMSEEVAVPLREELAAAAYRVERFMRQARLLAEAALAPIEGAFDASGIGARVRRRVGTVETEVPPPLDGKPVDDGVPLAEALGWGGHAGEARAEDNAEGEAPHSGGPAAAVIADAAPDDSTAQDLATPEASAADGALDQVASSAAGTVAESVDQTSTEAASGETSVSDPLAEATAPETSAVPAGVVGGGSPATSSKRMGARKRSSTASAPAAANAQATPAVSAHPLGSSIESESAAAVAETPVETAAAGTPGGETQGAAASPTEVPVVSTPGRAPARGAKRRATAAGTGPVPTTTERESESAATTPMEVMNSATAPSASPGAPGSEAPIVAKPPKRRRAQAPSAGTGEG